MKIDEAVKHIVKTIQDTLNNVANDEEKIEVLDYICEDYQDRIDEFYFEDREEVLDGNRHS